MRTVYPVDQTDMVTTDPFGINEDYGCLWHLSSQKF